MQERIIAGLDIGTSKIGVTVARLDQAGGAQYVGHGSVALEGIGQGEIIDSSALDGSLREATEEAGRLAGRPINDFYATVSGARLTRHERTGRLERSGASVFTQTDVMRALPDPGRHDPRAQRTIHRVVQAIVIDGEEVDDPSDVRGTTMMVKTRDFTADRAIVDGICDAAERQGCRIHAIVPAAVASGAAALTDSERQLGVTVIDIGHAATDVALYFAGALQSMTTFPIGGRHATLDLAQLLEIPFADAERVKRVYGAGSLDEIEGIDLGQRTIAGWQRQAAQGDPPREAVRTITGARMAQLFVEVRDWLNEQDARESLLAGAVLTGGGARLAGLEAIAGRLLRIDARIGGVVAGDGFPAIPDPSAAATIGIVRYCVSRSTKALPRRTARFGANWSSGGQASDRRDPREPFDSGGLVTSMSASGDRGWGRTVSRWMREFIPARSS